MKTITEIRKWLGANIGRKALGALTSHDTNALFASVALTPLISHEGASKELFDAYRAIVLEMQPQTRYMAFHAIAMELDWGHRFMIWEMSGLPEGDRPAHKACFERGGGGQERSEALSGRKARAL